MNIIFPTAFVFLTLFFNGLVDKEPSIIKKIDNTYKASNSSSDLYKLEALIQKSIKSFPESSKIFWRLGRTYFKLGENAQSGSEKIHYYLLCIEQTRKSIKINNNLASGYFFNGLCNGSLGQVQGIWSSLGKIKPFKKDMETAISIDPSIDNGGPHRAIANLYLQLPYLLGGDLDQSVTHFQEAIRFGPKYGENYLGLAEAYIQKKDFHLARDTLKEILNIKSDSQKIGTIREWHDKAISLLKQLQNK